MNKIKTGNWLQKFKYTTRHCRPIYSKTPLLS